MSLTAGIVGLPNVGKSTLFNAITNSQVLAENYPFATINPNVGVVEVPDKRMDDFVELFHPKKTIYTTYEFTDIAGLVKGASKGEGLGNQFLANISKVAKKAQTSKDKDAVAEYTSLQKFEKLLEAGTPVRLGDLDDSDRDVLKNYGLLTSKPVIYVANMSDEEIGDPESNAYYQKVKAFAANEGSECIAICAKMEEELSSLDKEEKAAFMQDLGIAQSGLDKIIRAAYHLLGLRTFFTVGEPECRAWTFHEGMKAPQCAGIIHTDFEKGFIRAEIYSYEDLMEYRTEQSVKEHGKMRLEGKEYLMKDGDVVFFRFNV